MFFFDNVLLTGCGRDRQVDLTLLRLPSTDEYCNSCYKAGMKIYFTDRPTYYHRRRSSVNFRGAQIFARKLCINNQQNARILHDSCRKNYQNTRIFMIFARKIYKIPEFYTIFARKNARILPNNCPKNIFSRILGGGTCPPAPLLCVLCTA